MRGVAGRDRPLQAALERVAATTWARSSRTFDMRIDAASGPSELRQRSRWDACGVQARHPRGGYPRGTALDRKCAWLASGRTVLGQLHRRRPADPDARRSDGRSSSKQRQLGRYFDWRAYWLRPRRRSGTDLRFSFSAARAGDVARWLGLSKDAAALSPSKGTYCVESDEWRLSPFTVRIRQHSGERRPGARRHRSTTAGSSPRPGGEPGCGRVRADVAAHGSQRAGEIDVRPAHSSARDQPARRGRRRADQAHRDRARSGDRRVLCRPYPRRPDVAVSLQRQARGRAFLRCHRRRPARPSSGGLVVGRYRKGRHRPPAAQAQGRERRRRERRTVARRVDRPRQPPRRDARALIAAGSSWSPAR